MENRNDRIDLGPNNLSQYDIVLASWIIVKEQWLWRNQNPIELTEGEEVVLRDPNKPQTEADKAITLLNIRNELENLGGGEV